MAITPDGVPYLLKHPCLFHDWARRKMPWSIVIIPNSYVPQIFREFLEEKGVRDFLVFSNEYAIFNGESIVWIPFPPWARELMSILKEQNSTKLRVSYFSILRALYRVEKNIGKKAIQKG